MAQLIICDPACVQEFGHNATGLKYFADAFASNFTKVVPLCCKHLPRRLVQRNGFVPFFNFYYEGYLQVPDGTDISENADAPRSLRYIDLIEARATSDALLLLQRWELGAADAVFFPSADFYGVVGLLNAIELMPHGSRPRVFLRFIGVMENATGTYNEPLAELILRLREALRNGIPLSVSAETPKYADMLAVALNVPVASTPYPHVGEVMPIDLFGPFVIYCPGSARGDKGYFHLWRIFAETREQDLDLSIRFVTQIMPDREAAQREHYTSQLGALPGVELLPAAITEVEMLEQYRRCHAVLLPYDTDIYALRGSAVMMEAAYLGRTILTLDGTAFADQIRYYGLGHVVAEVRDLPSAILSLSGESRVKLNAQARQARYRFAADSASAYVHWIKISR